ncbi:integrase-like protein [Mycolicibacterium moriokaense]|uniref:Integrase-like protein n=1 Tax=Mycolicibacterium moriokaense TaxID=39691 RepID=A0A318HLP2_9MYCO|nr:integrase-like protein [Mycolicibacterium moriokaense]
MHHLQRALGISERFACRVAGQNRTTQRRSPLSTAAADPDAGLRAWLRGWARNKPRRGFRSAYHDARAEGWHVNHKKIQRLWRDEGLRVPQRRRRKRLGTSTTPVAPVADAPNTVWAADFQFDATTDGRPVKIVSVVDEHTRECLGGLVDRSITGDDLIDELDRLATQRGYPVVLRCDNGPELACAAMADWPANVSACTSSHPANPGATATSSHSTAESATNASTSTRSGPWLKPESSSPTGRRTTTTADATARSATRPQLSTQQPAPTDERPSPNGQSDR